MPRPYNTSIRANHPMPAISITPAAGLRQASGIFRTTSHNIANKAT